MQQAPPTPGDPKAPHPWSDARKPRNKGELTALPILRIKTRDGSIDEYVIDKPTDDAVLVARSSKSDGIVWRTAEATVWMLGPRIWMCREVAISRQAAAKLVQGLKAGKRSLRDFDRWATEPPMSGQRLFDIIYALLDMAHDRQSQVIQTLRKTRRANAVKGALTNKVRRISRKVEASAIYAGPNPKTGKPWERKEDCITHLMDKKGWSRSAINSYLPTGTAPQRRKHRGGT